MALKPGSGTILLYTIFIRAMGFCMDRILSGM